MSLLDVDYIDIKIYYKIVRRNKIKKIHVIPKEEAEEAIKDPEKGKNIEVLQTKWLPELNWKDEKEISKSSIEIDPISGKRDIDVIEYRDGIIKHCLKDWNLLDSEGKKIPLISKNIDALPSEVVFALYQEYEENINYTEEEEKN